jgi:putrescine aminotransferase
MSRVNGYHGSTCAAASLGGMKPMHALDGLPLPGFEHIRQPYWYQEGGDLSPDEFGLVAARALEEKILELGAETVAAFIGEPVQGAGGVVVPPDTYWPEIQRICRKYGVLLIADEVICGFGRTGNWFGSGTFDIAPDIMTLAKGITSGYLPLSAVMVGDEIADVLFREGGEFAHGFTYSGHPVACAVALANIEIMEREGLVEKVRKETGPYFQARLRELAQHPLVGEVRGVGLLGGIEMVADKASRRPFDDPGKAGLICREACFANNVISRSVGDSMVLSPPLVIAKDEIDELMKRMRKSLDQTRNALEAA